MLRHFQNDRLARNADGPPADPYDSAAWLAFYAANPSHRRSVGAEGVNPDPPANPPADPPAAPDLSFVPETFVKDGAPDTKAFRSRYDEMAATLAQHEEAKAGLPKSKDDYGLDIDLSDILDDDTKKFLPEDWSYKPDPADPIVSEVLDLAAQHQVPKEFVAALMKIDARRDIAAFKEASEAAAAEMKALGPDAQSRVDTIGNKLMAKGAKEEDAQALIKTLTSAGAVRALEKALGQAPGTTPGTNGSKALMDLKPYDRLKAVNEQLARDSAYHRR